jgi:hypothetical protein
MLDLRNTAERKDQMVTPGNGHLIQMNDEDHGRRGSRRVEMQARRIMSIKSCRGGRDKGLVGP